MNIGNTPLAFASAALALAAFASPAAVAADDNAGMRVVRDGVTGELRAPTHEEFKAMQDEEKAAKAAARTAGGSAPAATSAPPTRLQRADGSKGMRVGDAFLTYSVVTRKADGSLDMDCVTGADAAEKIVSGKKPAVTSKGTKEHGHDHQ